VGGFIGEWGCSGEEWWCWSRRHAAADATRGNRGHVAGDDGGSGCAAKGAWVAVVRCKGAWGGGSAHGGRHACEGHG
jgi:hypothetical protein